MNKNTHGGPGRGQGRKSNSKKGLQKITWRDYEIIRLPKPRCETQAEVLAWFKKLEPFQKFDLIEKIYYSARLQPAKEN
jgi:hypothetical protein